MPQRNQKQQLSENSIFDDSCKKRCRKIKKENTALTTLLCSKTALNWVMKQLKWASLHPCQQKRIHSMSGAETRAALPRIWQPSSATIIKNHGEKLLNIVVISSHNSCFVLLFPEICLVARHAPLSAAPPPPDPPIYNLNSHLSFGLALVSLTWRDAGVLARSWPMTMTTPCLCQKHEMALLSSRSSRHFLRLLSIPMCSLYVRTVLYAWSGNAECEKRVPWLTRVSGHVNCPNEVQVCSMWKFEALDMRWSWQWHWFPQLLMSLVRELWEASSYMSRDIQRWSHSAQSPVPSPQSRFNKFRCMQSFSTTLSAWHLVGQDLPLIGETK